MAARPAHGPGLDRHHRRPPAQQVARPARGRAPGARASRWRPGRAARGTTARRPPRAPGGTGAGRPSAAPRPASAVSCGGTTSHSSVADLAAATASASAACRAAAGVTPDASYAGVAGGSGEGAADRAAYRGRPARRAIAASKIATHRRGDHVGVPLGRGVERAGAEPVPQVVVGAEPEQRGGHAGDRLGRDEQAVDLVPDDLARTGGAVEAHARDAGRHRLLQHEREPLGARGQRADARPGPLAAHVGRAAGQLDPVPESALAGLADQVRPLVALAEDPQPPARAAGRRRRRRPAPAW